ncbi:GNAT family N-acetyltransferase [Rossellomorea oryzaecorticis]|uniref:GNAT family N-acetyltransferase n=1 Tax=Rossellomorea oryzaecorticis TaxID=1396505 RepID=A0ABU9KDS1_9BACI
MDQHKTMIIPYVPEYAEQTVKMWRDSKSEAIGQKETHSFEDHVHFLNCILPKECQIEIALVDGKVVGMIAYNESEVSQLYIHKDYQGRGIGRRFLERAQKQSSGRLTLYTFEINKKARRFYEKHGFNIIGRGHENEENLPDILFEWEAE